MSKESTNFTEYFHYLVAARILFSVKDENSDGVILQSIDINAITLNDTEIFDARKIVREQHANQVKFMQHMDNNPNITVHDIVILNLMNLGKQGNDMFVAGTEVAPVHA